jgi:hypothetical protein
MGASVLRLRTPEPRHISSTKRNPLPPELSRDDGALCVERHVVSSLGRDRLEAFSSLRQ